MRAPVLPQRGTASEFWQGWGMTPGSGSISPPSHALPENQCLLFAILLCALAAGKPPGLPEPSPLGLYGALLEWFLGMHITQRSLIHGYG